MHCYYGIVIEAVLLLMYYRSRTVTRSSNKGVKGDLASVMEKQVVRCDEPIEPLLKTFFKNEHLDIG